jgi:hypothetical protein
MKIMTKKIIEGTGFELKSDSKLVKTDLKMLDKNTAVILLKWPTEAAE